MKRLIFLLSALIAAAGMASAGTPHSDEIVAILGDSNTWYGGDDCSGNRAWTKTWVEEFVPASARSYARSGATWTNTAQTRRNVEQNTGVLGNDNTIYNQVERLAEAVADGSQPVPTLILIMAGTNDAWFSSKRPGAFDMSASEAVKAATDSILALRSPSDVTSLALSVRHNVVRLRRIAPEATIVLIGPLQSVQAPDRLITAAGTIIEDMGREMRLPSIRLDRDFELSSAKESARKELTTDGTHTSVEGARRLGIFLADRVDGILKSDR